MKPRGNWGRDRDWVGSRREQGKGLAMGYENQAKLHPLCTAKGKDSGPEDRNSKAACGGFKEKD